MGANRSSGADRLLMAAFHPVFDAYLRMPKSGRLEPFQPEQQSFLDRPLQAEKFHRLLSK